MARNSEWIPLQLKKFQATRGKRISLVPLVDVVFILLLFFMLTTSVAKEKQLPMNYSSQSPLDQEQTLRHLTIESEEGDITSDDRTIRTEDQNSLVAWIGQDPDAVYVIDTLPEISTQALITVLDRLTVAGADNLVLKED
ncbi:MAG: biopolymer transporter ExbD [Gammaproteobacteria bacterium]|nr:biopolymer transporter ExbD [Gammaproteobacteria bacterium]